MRYVLSPLQQVTKSLNYDLYALLCVYVSDVDSSAHRGGSQVDGIQTVYADIGRPLGMAWVPYCTLQGQNYDYYIPSTYYNFILSRPTHIMYYRNSLKVCVAVKSFPGTIKAIVAGML